jgi:hypothetical protein
MFFQVRRESDGWHLYSPMITVEESFTPYRTKRAAITALTSLRDAADFITHFAGMEDIS